MMTKYTIAIVLGFAVSLATTGLVSQAQAQDLKQKPHTLKMKPQPRLPAAGQARFKTQQRHSKEEVMASQDYAWDCNAYGGGASTDPIGGETCTTPDGEGIVVPFP